MTVSAELTKPIARRVIESVGSSGTPPEYGFSYFTVGIDAYLDVIEDEYFCDYIRDGGSTFKLVVGAYGGGKTHFLYSVREIAWKHKYVVSYVQLSPEHSPFHKLDAVYRAVVQNLVHPMSPDEILSGYEQGVESFLKVWYAQKRLELESLELSEERIREELRDYADSIRGFESVSFSNAIRNAFLALIDSNDRTFDSIVQWLKGEGYARSIHGKYDILQRIDKSTAFIMLRSLIQFIRFAGYTGLAILLDEAEQVPSLSTKQKDSLLSNLRELIDECGHATFNHTMIMYAVPDINFLEGRTQIYEALRQRLSSSLDYINPTGVQIRLEQDSDPVATLSEIGHKLSRIYEVAYDFKFPEMNLKAAIDSIAHEAYERQFGPEGMHRTFVKMVIPAFHMIRRTGGRVTASDIADQVT
jgi:hypothetical protein